MLSRLEMRWRQRGRDDVAFVFGLLSIIPLLVWWLGWFPGFVSSDSVDQWGQVLSFDISNQHPAFHTWLMWLVSRVWEHPGWITLLHVMGMATVLALAARRLTQLGGRVRTGVAVAIGVAALPAVSITTIALWKDVPFTIALVWLFTELLALGVDDRAPLRTSHAARIGGALALIWLLRHNGFITVVLVAGGILWSQREHRHALRVAGAVLVGSVAFVNLALFPVVGVERSAIEPAGVFVSDVAASFVHEPGNFSAGETEYLTSIASLDVWRSEYDCLDSTPLVFSADFDRSVIEDDAGRFRDLVIRTYLRDPDTVLGHRWCAASYLLVPPQPSDGYFHRPPFAIADNPYGIARDPLSDRAFAATFRVFQWIEPPGRLWLTWRPALAVWLGALAVGWVWWRRRGLVGLGPAVLLVVAHVFNVALTTPAQEFRFAFGIYVMCLLLAAAAFLRSREPDQNGRRL